MVIKFKDLTSSDEKQITSVKSPTFLVTFALAIKKIDKIVVIC